jgi:hypothetical protein
MDKSGITITIKRIKERVIFLTINFENKLSEKNAKLLSSSINQMISAISEELKQQIDDISTTNEFIIHFDNGNTFRITVFIQDEFIYSSCKYENNYGERQETISLQDALNINKYARDIEILLSKLQPNYTFEAYYTEQPLNRLLPVFREREKLTIQKTDYSNINVTNIQYDADEPDLSEI